MKGDNVERATKKMNKTELFQMANKLELEVSEDTKKIDLYTLINETVDKTEEKESKPVEFEIPNAEDDSEEYEGDTELFGSEEKEEVVEESDFTGILEEFDDAFDDAEVTNMDDLPDGKYQVSVESVQLKESQRSGNPMLEWALRILTGDFKGRMIWRNNMLLNPENIRFLKQDLYTCGMVDLQKLSHLPARLEELINIQLEITKKTTAKDDETYENYYFNKKIEIELEEDDIPI